MKKRFLIPMVLLQIGVIFTSCKEEIIENIPTVVSLAATPTTAAYGSKVTVTAVVKDDAVNLYSAVLTYKVGEVELKKDTVLLTSKSETITKEFQADLFRNAPDNGKLSVSILLKNSEGGEATQSIETVTLTRPIFTKLYLKMQDNLLLEMTQRVANPDVFECAWTVTNDINVKVLTENTNPTSGLTWGDVAGAMSLAAKSDFYNLIDPLVLPSKITFNVKTFDLAFEGTTLNDGKTYIGMAQMNYETEIDAVKYPGYKVMRGTARFNNNGQVFFRNLPAGVNVDNILNPDFFEKRDGKYYFIRETGEYMIRYDETVGYIFMYHAQPAYPNGMFIAGWGFGCPNAKYDAQFYSDWSWNITTVPPGVHYYMPKVGPNIYECTIFVHVDVTDFMGFGFYFQRGWGGGGTGAGPVGAGEVNGTHLVSCNMESFAFAKGAIWRENVTNAPFTNGIYKMRINLNDRTLTCTLVQAKN